MARLCQSCLSKDKLHTIGKRKRLGRDFIRRAKRLREMEDITLSCPHCGGELRIRNPKGYCDHLYYPESCTMCAVSLTQPSDTAADGSS